MKNSIVYIILFISIVILCATFTFSGMVEGYKKGQRDTINLLINYELKKINNYKIKE